MHIRLKLMGAFRNKLPDGQPTLEVEPGSTVAAVLERLGIAAGHVHMVLVNGAMEKDRDRPLAEGDELTVFPPVAGGADRMPTCYLT